MNQNFGALSYLERIVNSLDYLEPSNIMELSLSKLNTILDCEDVETVYLGIKNSRHTISNNDFIKYVKFLENNHNTKKAKEMFKYISQLYNENEILQDNINYIAYLKIMATIKPKKLFSMRIHEIIEKLKICDINYENINEAKMLLNDV